MKTDAVVHLFIFPCGKVESLNNQTSDTSKLRMTQVQTRLKEIIEETIRTYRGMVCCLAGLEGGGKSTAATALSEASSLVKVVYVSKALTEHCAFLEGGGESGAPIGRNTRRLVQTVRDKMARRDKDIDPTFLNAAMHRALTQVTGGEVVGDAMPDTFVIVDGWPRRKWQAANAHALLGGFFPKNPALILEVGCDQREAHRRAVSRGGEWNTPENITRSHVEYQRFMPEVLDAAKSWSDHLFVNSDGPQVQTLSNLVEALDRYCTRIAGGNFKTPSAAPVPARPAIAPGAKPARVVPFTSSGAAARLEA